MRYSEILEGHYPEGSTIRLTDLYEPYELSDESEVLSHEVSPMEWDNPLTVRVMTSKEALGIMSRGELSLIDSFRKDASRKQKKIVADKKAHYDKSRIVVLHKNTIIDGNHHVVAGILSNNPIMYVDISEWD